jgi:ABC-type antimicrobial peptide transport system permease subunit
MRNAYLIALPLLLGLGLPLAIASYVAYTVFAQPLDDINTVRDGTPIFVSFLLVSIVTPFTLIVGIIISYIMFYMIKKTRRTTRESSATNSEND